jgi:hypothetical protein
MIPGLTAFTFDINLHGNDKCLSPEAISGDSTSLMHDARIDHDGQWPSVRCKAV